MVSLLGGIVAIVLGIIGLAVRWPGGQLGITYLCKALVATIPSLLVLGGCVAIGAGIGSIKDKARSEKEAEEKKTEEKKTGEKVEEKKEEEK